MLIKKCVFQVLNYACLVAEEDILEGKERMGIFQFHNVGSVALCKMISLIR